MYDKGHMSALRIIRIQNIRNTLVLFLLLFISGRYSVFAGAAQEQEDDTSES